MDEAAEYKFGGLQCQEFTNSFDCSIEACSHQISLDSVYVDEASEDIVGVNFVIDEEI